MLGAMCHVPESALFLTATEWARLSAEIEAQHGERPSPQNFTSMKVSRNLTVYNGGTDDPTVLDKINDLHAGANAIQHKTKAWRVR